MLGELAPSEIGQVLSGGARRADRCHADRRTYVVPVVYTYDDTSDFGHSAPGRKREMMRANRGVLRGRSHGRLANWRSVIAWGRLQELAGDEAERAMNCSWHACCR